jgi:Bacterial PH domain
VWMALAGNLLGAIRMQPEHGQGPELRNGKAGSQLPGPGIAAPERRDGQRPAEQKMFRLPGAIVGWWAWLVLAAACLIDIMVTGRDHTAAEIAATIVFITGLVYACALWPRVLTDSAAITVRNPLREHRIPWGSVTGVDVRESVQVHCAAEPGDKRAKVIHSWALAAQRRNRLRSELMAQGNRRRLPRSSFDSYGQGPERQKAEKQSAAQLMAAQLDGMAKQARERGAAAGPRAVSWSWQPVAAIVVPAIVLVLVTAVFR